MTELAPPSSPWWEDGVVYEVYPWSYRDSSGTGRGDIRGVIACLDHIVNLGADAIWMAPWNQSPGVDGGYDVSDYRLIHPDLGTLEDAEDLIAQAHHHGLKIIADMVANHTSDQHPWFERALAAAPGSSMREWYFFRDGKGEDGSLPPNNWISAFGNSGWTRIIEADGRPGQWYFHTFSPEQPDLNWANPHVREAMMEEIRYWFDRGIDGLRIDAAPAMSKEEGLPDASYDVNGGFNSRGWTDAPHWDERGVHDILRLWREVANSYPEPKLLVVESVVSSPERLADYLRTDEAHMAFNFDFLYAGWDAQRIRTAINGALVAHRAIGALPMWSLGSHDETRVATRLGRTNTEAGNLGFDLIGIPEVDEAVGLRRARAAAMIQLALPGAPCLYQGEELGLPEVVDLPDYALATDPVWTRSGGKSRGRAGCRVPLPWAGTKPPYAFSDEEGQPWLPQPRDWQDFTVSAQSSNEGSTLSLFREALRIRQAHPRTGEITWNSEAGLNGDAIVDFTSGSIRNITNMSDEPIPLPEGTVLLVSSEATSGVILPNQTVWLEA